MEDCQKIRSLVSGAAPTTGSLGSNVQSATEAAQVGHVPTTRAEVFYPRHHLPCRASWRCPGRRSRLGFLASNGTSSATASSPMDRGWQALPQAAGS